MAAFYTCIVLLAFIATVYSVERKNELRKCKFHHDDCIRDQINVVLRTLSAGDSKLNLLPFDPLHINSSITVESTGRGRTALTFTFFDNDIIGLKNFECIHVSGFDKKIDGEYEVVLSGPTITLQGDYNITGTTFDTPVNGRGLSNITLETPILMFQFTGEKKVVNERVHLYVRDLKYTFSTTRLHINLNNLYGGNDTLSKTTHRLFEKRWWSILKQLEQSAFKSFSPVYENYINTFLNKVPIHDLLME